MNLNFVNIIFIVGVVLILLGIKKVTAKEFNEYKLAHTNTHKIDELIAWGVFYLIFGVLIAASAIVTLSL